jgi:hypothetical protein
MAHSSRLVRDAKTVAREWVSEHAGSIPGFVGAYFAGSVNWLPDDAVMPATSDLDVNVVVDGPEEITREKILYRDLLLEITFLPFAWVRSPDQVLGHYHLAGGFRTPSVIADPSGHLTAIQAAVSREFARREWVRRRCEHARRRALDGLDALDPLVPFHQQVIGWLFPTGVTTHILLVAGLENPTVRRRYSAVAGLLAQYGQPPFQETLLALLGCEAMTRTQAERHLAALSEAFDIAAAAIESSFPFASDLSAIARPLAIDGSREMIEQGFHREAVFWIAVTYSRCQSILAADAPMELERFEPGYRTLLDDLGISSFAAIRARSERVKAHLPRVWNVAEAIIAANPAIEE